MEDWQVFYDQLKAHKRVKINPEVPSVVRMYKASDTLYKAFQEEINQTVRKHFKNDDEFQDHKISLSALKEVLGKNKNRSKKYKQKRQEVYESLAIYCGFEGYQDFQKLYQLYHRSIDIFQAFDILTSNHSNYLEQITKLLQEYEQQIQHFLPKGQEYDIQKLATVKVQSDKSIQEMKVYELLALASQHQDPLQRMHQIIYVQHEHFEKAETALVLYHKNKKRRKILIPSFLMGVLLLTLVSWYGIQESAKENQARQLTQADLDKIKIKILEIDPAPEGHATVRVAYDASHLGESLEGLNLELGGGVTKVPLSKSIDTLSLMYERGGEALYYIGSKEHSTLYHGKKLILALPDWISYVQSNDEITRERIWHSKARPKSQSMKNGSLVFNTDLMPDKAKRYYTTEYHYAKSIPVSLNNFSLEIKSKLVKDSIINATCFDNSIRFGNQEGSFMNLHINSKGCSKWLNGSIGEDSNRESNYDKFKNLSVPLPELQEWHIIKVTIKNQILTYTFNGQEIYRKKIKKLKGNLDTISQSFKGLGMLDYVKVWNGEGQMVYREEFEKAL